MSPTISVVIPTRDPARPLRRTLQSIADNGLRPGDEVLVVQDTHSEQPPEIAALVREFGAQFHWLAHDAGFHDWGHSQINCGISHAQGDYLVHQDDDDIVAPDGLAIVHRALDACSEPRPHVFGLQTHYGYLAGMNGLVEQGQIGGHCLVSPNRPGRLGRFSSRYEGDYDFIRATIDKWPNKEQDIVWVPKIIAIARPS